MAFKANPTPSPSPTRAAKPGPTTTPSPSGGTESSDDLLNQAQTGGFGGAYLGDNDVNWGKTRYSGSGMVDEPMWLTHAQAMQKFYDMSAEEKRQLGQSFYRAGLITNPNDFDAVAGQWENAVKMARTSSAANRDHAMTPWDAVDMMIQHGVAVNGGASGPAKVSDSRVTILSASDAKALITNIFQKELGHDPSDALVAKYSALLTGAAKASPENVTTNRTFDANGDVTASSTVQTTGSNDAQVLTDAIRENPEYGAYQAATTYFNALQEAFASPVKI